MRVETLTMAGLRACVQRFALLASLLSACSSAHAMHHVMRRLALAASLATARAMHMRNLGQSSLRVSEACLGTMTWGVQNEQRDADAQIDLAREHGVNFIDTAEMYPVPTFADQWRAGATEEILGDYLDRHKAARDELVIATKVTGYMPRSAVAAARTTPPTSPAPDCRLDAASVKAACDASLRRLKTDRVDLLQLHWPDRYVPLFGDTVYQHKKRDDEVPIEETAEALRDLADAGKIRAFGLSNETPFGVARWHQACEALGTSDGLASIQNSYSLVDRRFDADLAEACDRCGGIGLLPWSVLGGGLLSGKYRDGGGASATSRFIKYPKYMARWCPDTASPETLAASEDYCRLAEEVGTTPADLAIAFVRTRRFLDAGSVIVGATDLDQLEANLAPFGEPARLDDEVLAAIDAIHKRSRDPSCRL